jgi:CTP:molybdopterin cytidylyltransferase MocA
MSRALSGHRSGYHRPVTVAAVILAASTESALADVEGLPRVRRLADVAWSGGAVPIVVVAPDPDGSVATALTGAPVVLAEPAPVEGGPVAQIARGIDVALKSVRDTDAALIWPARLVWVGPETVTSLIESRGTAGSTMLRPGFDGTPGWPVVLPFAHLATLRGLRPTRMPDELIEDLLDAGVPQQVIELGDPGVTHDASTARADLPPYVGPPGPPAGHVHEWGAQVADQPEDEPLEGPALAPFEQASTGD